jgi:hypothetical protein
MARLPDGVRRAFEVLAPERRIADDVEDEVAFHLEMKTEELAARGWERGAARAEAMRLFGNVEQWRAAMGEIDRGRTRSARRAERRVNPITHAAPAQLAVRRPPRVADRRRSRNSWTGQPAVAACRRRRLSGLMANAWPTQESSGTSFNESP